MVFQKPTPFPMSIYDNIAFGIRLYERMPKSELDDRVEFGAARRRAVGRGQGQAAAERAQPVGRPAAAAVHRPRDRDPPGDSAARRAGLGARPDLDAAHRGADRRAERRLLHRDRHPQHAAGGAQLRLHGLPVSRRADRVRRDRDDLHAPEASGRPRITSPAGSAERIETDRTHNGLRTHRQEL